MYMNKFAQFWKSHLGPHIDEEREGAQNYRELALETKDPAKRRNFRNMANDEERHAEMLEDMETEYEIKPEEVKVASITTKGIGVRGVAVMNGGGYVSYCDECGWMERWGSKKDAIEAAKKHEQDYHSKKKSFKDDYFSKPKDNIMTGVDETTKAIKQVPAKNLKVGDEHANLGKILSIRQRKNAEGEVEKPILLTSGHPLMTHTSQKPHLLLKTLICVR